MNYTFSDEVRTVLAMARTEALRLGHGGLGAEHIFLALLGVRETVAWAALQASGVEPTEVRAGLESRLTPASSDIVGGELPYTPTGKGSLENAMRETRELDRWDVNTGHLLVGVLSLEGGVTVSVAESAGLSAARVREALGGIDESRG